MHTSGKRKANDSHYISPIWPQNSEVKFAVCHYANDYYAVDQPVSAVRDSALGNQLLSLCVWVCCVSACGGRASGSTKYLIY